jgi:CRP/FNR family transcriptional regulator
MTEDELNAIEETRYEVTYKPNEIIYKQGTNTSQIVTITDGLAKGYIEGTNDKNFIIDLFKPYTLISGPGIYVDFKHHFSLKAVEKTTCCFFSVKVLKDIINNNPLISEKVIEMISRRSISYFQKFVFLTQKQVVGRIAGNLIYLHDEIYGTNPINLTISYQDIAEMTGMTKDTVVRVLRDLCNEKIIEIDNTSIKILDFKKLTLFYEMG